jgi:hypothetical protein
MQPQRQAQTAQSRVSWFGDWFKKDWRVVAAAVYLIINLFDFIIFPILAMLLPHYVIGLEYHPWIPLTTQNGGLFHLAFGAILGVSAWRTYQGWGNDSSIQPQQPYPQQPNQPPPIPVQPDQ